MQQYAAVFRTGDVLKQGCVKMAELYNKMDDLKVFTLNVFSDYRWASNTNEQGVG